MAIVQLPTALPAQVGIFPETKKMVVTDNLATVTAAGYLNQIDLQSFPIAKTDVIEMIYSFDQVSKTGTYSVFTPTITNGVITLNQWRNPGNVTLPVTVNHIAKFVQTDGTIGDPSAAATNQGDIYAGSSGIAGGFRSYPASSNSGYLGIFSSNSSGNNTINITNASHNQSTQYTIPDIGQATGGIVVATGTIKQHAVNSANIAGGNTINTITDTFCTANSVVIGNFVTQSSPTYLVRIVPTNGSFSVISASDPGLSTFAYLIIN